MSSKELGMLHTVNFSHRLSDGTSEFNIHDLCGQLTEQLQRMVRQGQYLKVTGIDIGLQPYGPTPINGVVAGVLRYYAPTKGRCEAYRSAFKAMASVMKDQGISMRDNEFYDFRVPLRDSSVYTNSFFNGASFDGATEIAMNGAAPNGVFQVHNESVQPKQTGATFSSGFNVYGTTTDFVLNQNQQGFQGNPDVANLEFEEIPFQISLAMESVAPGVDPQINTSSTFQWRPDPALYLAILAGQFEIDIQETQSSGGANDLELKVSYTVSGWKSIMGNPDKKRRSRRSNGSSSRKTTTTTVTTKKS